MIRTIMIDLPSVSLVSETEWKIKISKFLDLIDVLFSLKGRQIIFREDIEQSHIVDEEIWRFWELLSKMETKSYNLDTLDKAKHTTSTPLLTSDLFPKTLNDEIILQIDTLHSSENTLVLISFDQRDYSSQNLCTTRDHLSLNHLTINLDNYQDIKNYVDSTYPSLKQEKHGSKGYMKGGRYVSPFSLYDPRNEEPAKELLKKAYDNYIGEETQPKYLYSWDSINNTYVEFRRSTIDGTYHGMDRTPDKVPEEVKKIYHHY